jgi:hypothetical protein
MKKSVSSLILAVFAVCALTACGRNPGANARDYPGTEKIQAALEAAQPRCVPFDMKRIRAAASVNGKEKFSSGKAGLFKLESYRISQASDRADRSVPNTILEVTEFDDTASLAPRLAIESKCMDLKNQAQSLEVSPITKINASNGVALASQPFQIDIDASGAMSAESRVSVVAAQGLPVGKLPEAVLLLGASYAETFKTLSFTAKSNADGSLTVKAEFIGMDANLSRLFVRAYAFTGFDAGE